MSMKINRKATAIAVAAAVAFSLAFWAWLSPETLELEMSIKVGDHVGFDVNTTRITFGTVPQGGISVREVVITNTADYDKIAHFGVDGNISSFVTLPADTLVKANRNTTISAKAKVPVGSPYGEYTGKFKVFLWRAI